MGENDWVLCWATSLPKLLLQLGREPLKKPTKKAEQKSQDPIPASLDSLDGPRPRTRLWIRDTKYGRTHVQTCCGSCICARGGIGCEWDKVGFKRGVGGARYKVGDSGTDNRADKEETQRRKNRLQEGARQKNRLRVRQCIPPYDSARFQRSASEKQSVSQSVQVRPRTCACSRSTAASTHLLWCREKKTNLFIHAGWLLFAFFSSSFDFSPIFRLLLGFGSFALRWFGVLPVLIFMTEIKFESGRWISDQTTCPARQPLFSSGAPWSTSRCWITCNFTTWVENVWRVYQVLGKHVRFCEIQYFITEKVSTQKVYP